MNSGDNRVDRVEADVTWLDKVPARRNNKREKVLALAETIAKKPGKWALIQAYRPTKGGRAVADQRATALRKPNSAFSKVGTFTFSVRYDPGYSGDYKGKVGNERGAYLLITKCTYVKSMHERWPGDTEVNNANKETRTRSNAEDTEPTE